MTNLTARQQIKFETLVDKELATAKPGTTRYHVVLDLVRKGVTADKL